MASSNTAGSGEAFDLLAHPYRRYVLYHLRTHSEGVDIDTLTAAIATERENQSATTGSDMTERIEIALRHTHLPKLADAGLIRYSQDGESIEINGIHSYGRLLEQATRIDADAPPAAGD